MEHHKIVSTTTNPFVYVNKSSPYIIFIIFSHDELGCNIFTWCITHTINPFANTFDIHTNIWNYYMGFWITHDSVCHLLYVNQHIYMKHFIKKLGISNVNFVFILMNALNTHHNLDVDVDNGNTTFPYQEILDNLSFASTSTT